MADNNEGAGGAGSSGTGGGAGEGGQGAGQASGSQGGANAGAAPSATGQESGKQETFSAGYVKELRNEAAANRTKASELETRATTAETKVAQLEQRLRARDVEAEVAKHAGELKIASASAAFKLLDQSKVQFDKDGNPTNVKELLTELIKTETFLVNPAVTTNSTNPAREGAKFTREQIEKMTPAEINANWDEVQKVLAAG